MTRRAVPAVLAAAVLLLSGCATSGPAPAPTGGADDAVATCPETAAAPSGTGRNVVSGSGYFVDLPVVSAHWFPVESGPSDVRVACAVEVGTDLVTDGVRRVGETLALDDEGTTVTLLTIREDGDHRPLGTDETGGSEPTQAVYWLATPEPPTTGCAQRVDPPDGVAGEVLVRTVPLVGSSAMHGSQLTSDGCGLSVRGGSASSVWLRVGQSLAVAGTLVTRDGAEGMDLLAEGSVLLSVDLTVDPSVLELRVWVPPGSDPAA